MLRRWKILYFDLFRKIVFLNFSYLFFLIFSNHTLDTTMMREMIFFSKNKNTQVVVEISKKCMLLSFYRLLIILLSVCRTPIVISNWACRAISLCLTETCKTWQFFTLVFFLTFTRMIFFLNFLLLKIFSFLFMLDIFSELSRRDVFLSSENLQLPDSTPKLLNHILLSLREACENPPSKLCVMWKMNRKKKWKKKFSSQHNEEK